MGVRAKVVPVVIGALGTVPLRLKFSLKAIGVDTLISFIQKISILGVGKNTEECVTDVKLEMR